MTNRKQSLWVIKDLLLQSCLQMVSELFPHALTNKLSSLRHLLLWEICLQSEKILEVNLMKEEAPWWARPGKWGKALWWLARPDSNVPGQVAMGQAVNPSKRKAKKESQPASSSVPVVVYPPMGQRRREKQ
jgi:hypothetical protein